MSDPTDPEQTARSALAALLDREADQIAAMRRATGSVEAVATVVAGDGERRLRAATLAAERAGDADRAAAGRTALDDLRRLRRAAREAGQAEAAPAQADGSAASPPTDRWNRESRAAAGEGQEQGVLGDDRLHLRRTTTGISRPDQPNDR